MTSKETRDQIRLMVEGGDAESVLQYFTCPECNGPGKLMIVTRDDGSRFFNCLKAGCTVNGDLTWGAVLHAKPKQLTYPFQEGALVRPDDPDAVAFRERFSLSVPAAQRLVSGESLDKQYWYFPIYAPDGCERGFCKRLRNRGINQHGPKLRSYRSVPGEPLISWYGGPNSGPGLAVVEDQISAARLSGYCTAVALLGTDCPAQAAIEIEGVAHTLGAIPTVLLDSDATAKGMDLARRLGGMCLPLFDEDVKDMSEDKFQYYVDVIRRVK